MGVIDTRTFDAIVAGFYRAAMGEIGWGVALQRTKDAFGARLALLHTMDMAHGGRLDALSYSDGEACGPEAVMHYVRDWHRHDPRRARFLAEGAAAIGQWRFCEDAFDDRRAARDPFFRDYLAAYDSRYNANVVLPTAPDRLTAFVLELPAARGPLSADERVLAARLGRLLQDALHQHERVRRLAAEALAGHGLTEAFSFPIWLLDADRFVWHANAAARAAQQQATMVDGQGARLRAIRDAAHRQLTQCLLDVGVRGHGARARVDVRCAPGEPPAWLLLQAVVPAQALGAFGDRPLVMATLLQSDAARLPDPLVLADAFGLTPAQARVAALLADGLTGPDIAARLGCRLSTVRTHLRAVLQAMAVRRLTDAVRLLQGSALWWADDPGVA